MNTLNIFVLPYLFTFEKSVTIKTEKKKSTRPTATKLESIQSAAKKRANSTYGS